MSFLNMIIASPYEKAGILWCLFVKGTILKLILEGLTIWLRNIVQLTESIKTWYHWVLYLTLTTTRLCWRTKCINVDKRGNLLNLHPVLFFKCKRLHWSYGRLYTS